MNRTHLTPLGKLVLLICAVSLVWGVGAAGASALRPRGQTWQCITVRPGDTLWGLAQTYVDGDPRKGVDALIAENELAGASLQPGSALWVPKGVDAGAAATDAERCVEQG